MSRFKITHTYPDITPKENEEIQKDILLKMYKLYMQKYSTQKFNKEKLIETKVKK